jgi:hypothetical protein
MNYHLRLLGEPPVPPPDSDFSFTIGFQKGQGDPRRVFDAASALIDAFEVLDKALVDSIDVTISTLMVLEDVEASSLKAFFKNVLQRVDDEGLKTGDWKLLVGHYLVKAKYIVLEWCDKEGPTSVDDLRGALVRLAQETDVRQLPDYAPVSEGKLLVAMDRIQRAKGELDSNDRLTIESEDRIYEVDLGKQWEVPKVQPVQIGRETESKGEIILTIRKPDFIKDTMWLFTFGGNPVSARILDIGCLDRFHRRQIPLIPGDALRCAVTFTYEYDAIGTLIDQKIAIDTVLEVIPGAGPPVRLL